MEIQGWNSFTILTLLSCLVNASLGAIILVSDPRHRLNRLYALLTLGLAWWAGMKLGIAFSSTASLAAVHYKLSGVGWILMPTLYFHFSTYYTSRHRQPGRRLLLRVLYGIAVALIAVLWVPGVMLKGMRPEWWGWADVPGPLYNWCFQPYLLFGFCMAIVDLIRHGRQSERPDDRRRTWFVLTGMAIPLVGGTITDMLLPSLGIFVFELAIPLTTLNAAVIAYAMFRYRLLNITVEHAASVIIDTMGDALLVLGPAGNVRLVNPATLELLGYEPGEIVGLPADRLIRRLRFDAELNAQLLRDGTLRQEADLISSRGEPVAASLSVSTLRDRRRRIVGYVVVGKDIRELRRLITEIEAAKSEVEQLAITDALTGLYNRRFFNLRLTEELLRSRRFDRPFSLIVIDLDHFKDVNDRFGHAEGDWVLKRVAELILPEVRIIDTVCRYGGDEFVVILPETAEKQAVAAASRIRERLSGDALPEEYRFVTASCGVATFDPTDPKPDEDTLFRLADSALLQAKRTGKNRVVHAREALPERLSDEETDSETEGG